MAKKQVFGLKSGRGLCPVCGEKIQHVKIVVPSTAESKTYKFIEDVVKVCSCPGKKMNDYLK